MNIKEKSAPPREEKCPCCLVFRVVLLVGAALIIWALLGGLARAAECPTPDDQAELIAVWDKAAERLSEVQRRYPDSQTSVQDVIEAQQDMEDAQYAITDAAFMMPLCAREE